MSPSPTRLSHHATLPRSSFNHGLLGLLAALEGVLQLLDAGPSSRLFVESRRGGTVVYEANQRVGHRFFPPQYVRSVPANPSFPRYKPPDT